MNQNSSFKSINPYTEELLATYAANSDAILELTLKEMKAAQLVWRNKSVQERVAFLPKLAELLRLEADSLAKIASIEMGKLLAHAKAEVLKSASLCDYYYAEAASILKPTNKTLGNNVDVELQYQAMGIILGIFPWNFPYWQILRSAIPSIVSGNAMLVKPAPNVPQSSLALQVIIDKCGLPKNLFVNSFIEIEQIEKLIAHPHIAAVTLTGSGKAGANVAALAAKYIKPAVLELGGNDPLILLEDAPLNNIIDEILFSRFQNNGQSCVAAKRFIVHQSLMPAFKELAIQKVAAFLLGNPIYANTQIGPLARKDLQEKLAAQVLQSLSQGAQILFQHKQIPSKGYFFPPTLLYQISDNNIAREEEFFGPVLSIYSYNTEAELIALANQTPFGLGASIFSNDLVRAKRLSTQIEAGMVYINQMVKSDVSIPFGGIKNSGFGRELGPEGLLSFCQRKTVWLKQV
ncbi:MAG: aldehyde dehydrogenase family protein [bacterium]|nr:aldehyde dehydrogenase family protein [bacterium]